MLCIYLQHWRATEGLNEGVTLGYSFFLARKDCGLLDVHLPGVQDFSDPLGEAVCLMTLGHGWRVERPMPPAPVRGGLSLGVRSCQGLVPCTQPSCLSSGAGIHGWEQGESSADTCLFPISEPPGRNMVFG